jgi:hypothetical protein
MSDKPYTVKTLASGEFDAEEYYAPDEGMVRFVIESYVDSEGQLMEKVRYVPLHDIIRIDGFEYVDPDDDEEDEPEEDIEMSREE